MAQMSETDKQILEEIKYFEDRYFTFDEPVPFCGLQIYPITVRNFNEFMSTSSCFTLNKNDDIKGLKRTHLEYLYDKMKDPEEGQIWSYKFSRLMELIFRIKNGLKCEKCGKVIDYEEYVERIGKLQKGELTLEQVLKCECGGDLKERISFKTDEKTKRLNLIIDGNVINTQNFARLRRIPLYQNMPDYMDDSWVEKSIRDDQALKAELESKKGGGATASLERKILCISAKSCYKIEEIYNMSMRKFIMYLGVIDDAMNYEVTRLGSMTGMVSMKGPIEHWVYKKPKKLYGDSKDFDQLSSQVTSV